MIALTDNVIRQRRRQAFWLDILAVLVLVRIALGCAAAFGQGCYVDPWTGQRVCPRQQGAGFTVQGSGQQMPRPSLPANWQDPNPALVRIDGATGVVLDLDGDRHYVVTCQHGGVHVGEQLTIEAGDGSRARGVVVAVGDGDADCALVRTDQAASRGVQVAASEPRIGSLVTLYGFTGGGPLQRKGLRITNYGDPQLAEAAGAPDYGDSGGPVVDTNCRLVGILSGAPGGPAYYCRLQPIRRMLDRVFPGRSGRIIPHADAPTAPTDPAAGWAPATSPLVAAPSPTGSPPVATQPAPMSPAPPARLDSGPGQQSELGGTSKLDQILADLQNLYHQVGARAATAVPAKVVRVVGAAATFCGLNLPPWLVGLGAIAGGPVGTMAAGLVWWRLRRQLSKSSGGSSSRRPTPRGSSGRVVPVAVDSPPPPQTVATERHYVPYEQDTFRRAHDWAAEQIVRKYPGAQDIMSSMDSLIEQQLAGQRQEFRK